MAFCDWIHSALEGGATTTAALFWNNLLKKHSSLDKTIPIKGLIRLYEKWNHMN